MTIKPFGRRNPDDDFVIGYMDLDDFKYGIGSVGHGGIVYPTVEAVKFYHHSGGLPAAAAMAMVSGIVAAAFGMASK